MRTLVLFVAYYGAAAYGLFNPLCGVLLFLHMLILRPENLVWGNAVFGRLHLVAFLCAIAGYVVRIGSMEARFENPWTRRGLSILGAFVVWALIVSAPATDSAEASFNQTVEIGKIWLLCWLLSRIIVDRREIAAYVTVVNVSAAVVGLWGILQGMRGNYRLDELGIGGSNYVAAQLVLVAPMCLAAALDAGRSVVRRLGYAAGAVFIVTCSLYTGSRGGFLGMMVALVFLGLLIGRQHFLKFVLFAIMSALIVIPMLPDAISERLATVFISNVDDLDTSAASRTVLWRIAFEVWTQHPLFGVGLNNFSAAKDALGAIPDWLSVEVARLIFGRNRMPHSVYFGLLAETGVVGVGLLCWMIGRAVLVRVRSVKESLDRGMILAVRGAQAGVAGFAIAAAFSDIQYIELLYAQIMVIGAGRQVLVNRVRVPDADAGVRLTSEKRTAGR